jgi:hypothetical protein
MDQPAKNDPFYQLMQDSRLHLENPGLEEDILKELHQVAHHSPVKRNTRMSILFLLVAIISGLVLSILYATQYPLVSQARGSASLFLMAPLILTFLFLFEKILQLMLHPERHPSLK